MTQIIYSCYNGLATEGVVVASAPLNKVKIFVDDPMNLIGFRTSTGSRVITSEDKITEYIEIGYFMEMLYEGIYDAFKVLKTLKEYVEYEYFDFDILRREEESLMSRNLVDSLISEATRLFQSLEDPEQLNVEAVKKDNEFLIQKLAYNNLNAYICLRNLMLAETVLKDYKFDLDGLNTVLLQAVLDGKFSLSAIADGYKNHMDNISELEKTSNLPLRPDFELMNKILQDIRNVKVETLNTTRG